MKFKTAYICEKCSYQSQKWLGKCPGCEAWNSFYEEVMAKSEASRPKVNPLSPTLLIHSNAPHERIHTKIEELDRVLGGGIVKGNVILLSGEPGIGKSTLTLQLCARIAEALPSVLYISGEESDHQIATRAARLKIDNENIKLLNATDFETILATIEKDQPGCIIVDSIQVISSSEIPSLAGSINQVRFCTESLVHFAKKTGTPVIIIGHVTKDGNLAGPRILEHLVDTVLFLEGERYQQLRLIRSLKNRFGSTNEIGVFEMSANGLQEITNASHIFIQGRKIGAVGSAVTVTIEGTRPFLIEVQALTNLTSFGYPKRAASGFDLNRLQLLAAVIQKHLSLNLSNQDIYINLVGGFKLNEPALDLAVAMAIISSFKKEPLPSDTIYFGEIGLSGELRSVTQIEKRLKEAEKMGFKVVVMPKMAAAREISSKLKVVEIEDLKEGWSQSS
jgi:DNA repair protein RadA/Sms